MSAHLPSVEAFVLKNSVRLGIHKTKIPAFARKLAALGEGREGFPNAIRTEAPMAFDLVNEMRGDVANDVMFVAPKRTPKAPEAVEKMTARERLSWANGDAEAKL